MAIACSTQLQSAACSFLIERRSPTLLYVRIEGHDVGEFGELPMRCIEALLPPELPAQLFIDARRTRGATMQVSNDWSAWLGRNRNRFEAIHMLAGSRYVHFTAEFVRRFSELEQLMRVHDSDADFDAELAAANASAQEPGTSTK
jgi:hypothetical protein